MVLTNEENDSDRPKNELYEIHISVDPTQVCELKIYCLRKNIKYLLACSLNGENRNQLMSSAWFNGSKEGAIDHAKQMAADMKENANLRIERIKVEAMFSNACVPREADQNFSSSEYYFEFHAKVEFNDSLEKLEQICEKMRNEHCKCAFSFNAFTNKPCAIVTLRINGFMGGNGAIKQFEKLSEFLRKDQFLIISVQREFSIFDTNDNYDNGWL